MLVPDYIYDNSDICHDEPSITLDDGALPGGHTVRGGVFLSCRLGQHGDGAATQSAALLGHLVVTGVKVLLALPESLLQEGRLSSTPGPTSDS